MISKKTKYALKAVLALARNHVSRRPMLIADLAAAERLPKKFLELILLDLKKKGLLISKKGKGGGYMLSKNPDLIPIGEIIRIFEGNLSPLPCLSQSAYEKCDECVNENTCAIRLVMKRVKEATVQILDGTSLQEMLEREASEEPLSYAI